MIDLLRGKDTAFAFVSSLQNTPALSVVTVMEFVAGCRSVKERRQIDRLHSHYVIHDIDRDVASLAGDYIRQYGPSHGTDPIDALLAATAKTRGLSLATLNIKHFPHVR